MKYHRSIILSLSPSNVSTIACFCFFEGVAQSITEWALDYGDANAAALTDGREAYEILRRELAGGQP